jgi:class 3 adenylate cyclase
MANPLHLAYIDRGRDSWNLWRATSGVRPDLSHAPLSRISLAGYNFAGADCRRAIFLQSDLSGCQFGGANLAEADVSGCQLKGSIFSHTSICGGKIIGVDFSGSSIDGVNFSEANLERSSFCSTSIRFCDFMGTKLAYSDFTGSRLCNVNLSGADLRHASFYRSKLSSVNLAGAWVWNTKMTDWELLNVDCGLLRTGRGGTSTTFAKDEFEKIFATKTIKIHLPEDQDPLEVADLNNLIYMLGRVEGSFSISLETGHALGSDDLWREAVIRIEPNSVVGLAEADKLKNIIDGLELMRKVSETALEAEKRRAASLTEKLLHNRGLWKLGPIDEDWEEEERRLTVAVFDLAGSSDRSAKDNIAATATFWGFGVPLVRDRRGKYLNTWGDALITCFEDVAIALESAWKLIAALDAIGIKCRAGLHHGDVWIRYNPLIGRRDIAGPTVHLAARLEPLADPCSMIVSREVKNLAFAQKLDEEFEFSDRQVTLQKGAGAHVRGAQYVASVVTRKSVR